MGLKADIDLSIIKPLLSLNERSDGDVLHRLNSVYDGMLNNPAYPNPPVDMAGFKAVIDAYTTAAAAAQHDGGKNAIIERDKRRADAIIMCRLLGHYVEPACQNDLKTFASSGFTRRFHGATKSTAARRYTSHHLA